MDDALDRLAGRPEVLRVAAWTAGDAAGDFARDCVQLWERAAGRSRGLGPGALEAVQVTAPSALLIAVRRGDAHAAALVRRGAVPALVRYELAEVLTSRRVPDAAPA